MGAGFSVVRLEAFSDAKPVVSQPRIAVGAIEVGLVEGVERRQCIEKVFDADLNREIREQSMSRT